MTKQKPDATPRLAARLQAALAASDELSCAEAEAQLPDLVAAEQAGVDVDADPHYAALLRHLDSCDGCLALYEALSEGVAALDPAQGHPLVATPAHVPTFFDPPPAPTWSLRVLDGLRRRFTLGLPLPQPLPLVGTLGGAPQATVFDQALPELNGSPTLTVTIRARGSAATLLVALHESGAPTAWNVELRAGTFAASALSDGRGIATFADVPLADLVELELTWSELSSEQ